MGYIVKVGDGVVELDKSSYHPGVIVDVGRSEKLQRTWVTVKWIGTSRYGLTTDCWDNEYLFEPINLQAVKLTNLDSVFPPGIKIHRVSSLINPVTGIIKQTGRR